MAWREQRYRNKNAPHHEDCNTCIWKGATDTSPSSGSRANYSRMAPSAAEGKRSSLSGERQDGHAVQQKVFCTNSLVEAKMAMLHMNAKV